MKNQAPRKSIKDAHPYQERPLPCFPKHEHYAHADENGYADQSRYAIIPGTMYNFSATRPPVDPEMLT